MQQNDFLSFLDVPTTVSPPFIASFFYTFTYEHCTEQETYS